jgi:peptide/nickel transport system substrate-binding protein
VPERGDTVVLALLGDIEGFNPYTSSSADSHDVQEMIFPRLLEEQPDYYAGPPTWKENIAFPPTAGADGLSRKYTLRECTWSDGTPLTSEDVRFSWQAAANEKVAWVSKSIVDYITDVEVHSPREFTVRYSKNYPYQVMDINDVSIIPRHVFGKVPFEQWQKHGGWFEEAKVSGGPWLFEEYKPNTEVSFVPNPRYWDRGKPYLNKVIWRVQGSMETNLNALLSGDVDFMTAIFPKDIDRVFKDGDVLVYSYQSRTIGWIGWNVKKAPLDDARVRRALSMAIDRDNIVESVLYGYGKPAGALIISSMWASNKAIAPMEFDPDKAEALLDEAGWKREGDVRKKDGKPLSFSLVTNQGNEVRKRICEYIQASMKEIGVQVDLRLQDFNQLSQQLKRHNFEAYLAGMQSATKVDGSPLFSTGQGFNYPDYSNPRVDELIKTAREISDQAKAQPLWNEMQEILHQDQPYTALYEPRGLTGLAKRIRNARVAAPRPTYNLHEWWVPKAEQKWK